MSLLDPRVEAFYVVAKTGTVQASAKKLNITQTGVTQRIRSLEKQLSTTLFTRSRLGMRLTSEGEALFRYCEGASSLEGFTLSRIQGDSSLSPVSISIAGPTSI